MATLTVEVPDALWQRMQAIEGEDWSRVATRAFAARLGHASVHDRDLPGDATLDRLRASKERYLEAQRDIGYRSGYSWARDRAEYGDLHAMAGAPTYDAAARVARDSRRFSERDEFGDAMRPSDEMWEAFVDGATALYRDVEGNL